MDARELLATWHQQNGPPLTTTGGALSLQKPITALDLALALEAEVAAHEATKKARRWFEEGGEQKGP